MKPTRYDRVFDLLVAPRWPLSLFRAHQSWTTKVWLAVLQHQRRSFDEYRYQVVSIRSVAASGEL